MLSGDDGLGMIGTAMQITGAAVGHVCSKKAFQTPGLYLPTGVRTNGGSRGKSLGKHETGEKMSKIGSYFQLAL